MFILGATRRRSSASLLKLSVRSYALTAQTTVLVGAAEEAAAVVVEVEEAVIEKSAVEEEKVAVGVTAGTAVGNVVRGVQRWR